MYYPLEKVTPNLYTSGGDFYKNSTNKDYSGVYFSTYDGKYFTGATPSGTSEELTQYTKQSEVSTPTLEAYTYNNLLTDMTPHLAPTQYISVPTEEDYQKGNYQRYFSKRVNGDESTIQEITKDAYEDLADNPLYIRLSIPWYISGMAEDRTTGGVPIYGVLNRNIHTLRLNNSQMMGIDKYLSNPLQHYRK